MTNNYILVRSERQEELEAAKAAFFMSGNSIEVLEPFKFKPRDPRKDIDSPLSKSGPRGKHKRTSESHFVQRKAYVDTIRELAKTMTIDQAMTATGKSESAMRRAAQEGDFTFKSKHADLDRDMKLIERLTALRDAGISRFSGCKQVEISDTLLRRLEMQYDFSYPKRWSRLP